jgi:hypothetical protein
VLDRELGLTVREVPYDASFALGARVFHSVLEDDFSVFLDRLHDSTGHLIGIEVAPAVADLRFSPNAGAPPYAHAVGEGGVFRILFWPAQGGIAQATDQAFGARLFESADGVSALAFPAYFLSAEEVAQLVQLESTSD